METRSVRCLSQCALRPRDAPRALLRALYFPFPSFPSRPSPSVTRSREKTHAITHDIHLLHVEGAPSAQCRAQLHVEGRLGRSDY